jgi:hypothetical protein
VLYSLILLIADRSSNLGMSWCRRALVNYIIWF